MNRHLLRTAFLLTLLLIWPLKLMAAPDKPPAKDESHDDLTDVVKVSEEKTADHGVTVWAQNRADYPVTVRLDLPQLDNLKSSVKLPAQVVIQPRKKQFITRLSRVNARAATRYAFQWTYHIGWRSDKPDTYLYTLPFKCGYAYRISQGFNGGFSHQGKNALDFLLPDGATICAARGGTVVEVIQHNTEGGISDEMKSKANRVLILHDDGSTGRYAHLQHNGALVKVGQKVQAGDEIGLAGATGYAQGPHLHFEVDRPPLDGTKYDTVAMQFVAQAPDGSEVHITPKEFDVLMRPYAPNDPAAKDSIAKRWPVNAIGELKLCRGMEENKPVGESESFRADDTLCIYMRLNLPAECTLNVSIAQLAGVSIGKAPTSQPATQPLFNRQVKCDLRGTFYYFTLGLANHELMRGGCVVRLTCDGKELASKAFSVSQ